MASRAAPAGPAFSARERRSSPRKPQGWWQRTRAAIHTAMVRLGWWLGGGALALGGLALAAALLSWQALDPSLNTATAEAPANWLGVPGSYTADALLQLLGWPVLLLAPVLLAWGLAVARQQPPAWGRRLAQALAGLLLLAMAVGALAMPLADAPAGPGGLPGLAMAWLVDWLADWPQLAGVPMGLSLGLLLAPLGLLLLALGTGLGLADLAGIGPAMGGLMRRWWPASAADDDAEEDVLPAQRRREPAVVAVPPAPDAAPGPVVVPREAAPAPGKRATQGRQAALDLGDTANLPGLDLLKPPPAGPRTRIDPASLEHNARLLEGVLEDFGVRGRIGEVRPGPVVTMYELEPAPGIKSSRVVGLADDIARSMSALSARVAVVPGRNAIGIELPNPTRETVSLAELLGSAAFDSKGATLPLVLGKDIGGEPVIADLAPMPHLLIAGTTGSGKSVGLNAMILSLLYRMTPAQCRLIMIDPKMLELKMYDGIPHLLAPVVTEPGKAIRALKWAVDQMEDRYLQMSELGVRNLAGFNQKVADIKRSGKPFIRRVHTGWDPETEAPIIEEQVLDFQPLPLVVVVVDELADLMITAGKEVEILIQRLAQKARAAGIHLIMATQRPSVDVITGVIKANLPNRISFQVTSKIDSRTILGEQGAEQLLGKGDMLWMSGGRLARVHGPFVSDEEVEAVAEFWRRQGTPDYVDAVTEDPGDLDGQLDLPGTSGGALSEEADLLTKAIDVVARAQKASTSYVQRQLRVGYNNAARLIEQMEDMGIVSKPDHSGRREVLVDENGNRR